MRLCIINEKLSVSPIDECNVFLEDFHAHIAADESINLHWVFDCVLKTQYE